VNGPPKATQNKKDQQHRQWDQQIQDIHQNPLVSRNAFNTTHNELNAMPSPASQAGNQPTTAKGTHKAL
jgi:ABC-type oligopeptide transport system ATPase subunit